MNNNITSIKIASCIVSTYYEFLIKLSSQNLEDTTEYYEIISKLEKALKAEENIYDNLTDKDYQELIAYFKTNEINNSVEGRIYTKTKNYERMKEKAAIVVHKNFLLSSIITTKLLIDVLKLVNQKIDNLEDDKEILKIYSNIIKYTYLTSNNFIESIALENNYDIDAIPIISFYAIEEISNIKFIDLAQDLFMEYIKESIKELDNIDTDDIYLEEYTKLFECSRIEIMLPYLDKESLISLSSYLSNLNENNEALKKIKELVNKRKEGLE